jgi:Xaa-Pro aminopeptidase
MTRLGQEKSQQAIGSLDDDQLWLFITQEGSDPAVRLVFDLGVSGQAALMLHRKYGALALVAGVDRGHVERLGIFAEIRDYRESFADALGQWLREIGPREVLLNYSTEDHLCDGLSHGQYLRTSQTINEALPQASISSSQQPLVRVRARKSAEELRRLRTAIDGIVSLYDRLLPQLKIGQTEREIQQRALAVAAEIGLEPERGDYGGPLVLINRAGMAHRAPGDDRLEEGDLLILDGGLVCEGYVSDVARTIYVRREHEDTAPEPEARAFQSVYDAITAAFDTIRPGRQGWQVDAAARRTHLDNGYPEIRHATGHQIGRAMHDGGALFAPPWERYGSAPHLELEEGQVFTLEPTILQSPDPSILVEENVLVTGEGAEWLSPRQETLWYLPRP